MEMENFKARFLEEALNKHRKERSEEDTFKSLADLRIFLNSAKSQHDGNLEMVNTKYITHVEKRQLDRLLAVLNNPYKKGSLEEIMSLGEETKQKENDIDFKLQNPIAENDPALTNLLNSQKYFLEWLRNKISAVSGAMQTEETEMLFDIQGKLNYRQEKMADKEKKDRMAA